MGGRGCGRLGARLPLTGPPVPAWLHRAKFRTVGELKAEADAYMKEFHRREAEARAQAAALRPLHSRLARGGGGVGAATAFDARQGCWLTPSTD